MKKNKVWLPFLVVLAFVIAVLSGCTAKSTEDKLQGRWLFEEEMETGIELYSDGEGIGFTDSDTVSLSWNASDDRLRLYNPYEDEQIIFEIEELSEDQLVLTSDGDTRILIKDGSTPENSFAFLLDRSPWMILICAGIVLLIVILLIVIAAVSHRSGKKQDVPTPQPQQAPSAGQMEETELLWDDSRSQSQEGPSLMLILTDVSNPTRRFGAPVRGTIAIGRDISVCRIVLGYDSSVARHQCDVFMENGTLMLQNRSHSNITQVDGQRVEDRCPLRSGSILKMGRVQMRVEVV